MLKSFRPFATELCVVVNGEITDQGRQKIKPYIDNLLLRENKGLDAEAYAH